MTVPVTFVSSHSQHGGSEIYLARLLDELGSDWIGEVVCLQDGPLVERLRAAGRPVITIPTGSGPFGIARSAFRLRSHLKRGRASLVHANGIKAALVCALAGTSFVWVKHDVSWDGFLARMIARRAAKVVAVSRVTAAAVEDVASVEVVPTGVRVPAVDRIEAAAALKRDVGIDPSTRLIVQLGRIHPVKGQRELVVAAPGVVAAFPEVAFVLAGERDPSTPEYAESVDRAIAEGGMRERFHLLGHRDDPFALLAACDVCVIPTTADDRGAGEEGFGLVALEAMGTGTPVVAYASGALPEVLGDCGIVVDRKPEALANAIVRVLGDEELRRRLVDCGSARVTTYFSVEHMVDRMREIYGEAAS